MTIPLNNTKVIGVDLGGTKVKVGLIAGSQILRKAHRKLPLLSKDEWDVINLIIDLIKEITADDIIDSICVGVPSILDKKQGIVHEVQNIPTWKEVPLASILEKEFNVAVHLDNDANCFALGEYYFGLGQGCDNMVGITLGTGLGAGIISGNQIINGSCGGAGEFGMIPYRDGIIEDYCAGNFFKHKNTTGEILMQKAVEGDKDAQNIFNEFGEHLGNAIKIIMYTVDPEKIIIGGSITKSAAFFDASLKRSISDFSYKKVLKNLRIEYSDTLDIALLGAGSLALKTL